MNTHSWKLVTLLLGTSLFVLAFSDLTLAGQLEQSEQNLPVESIPVDGLVAQYTFSGNTRDTSGNGFHCARHGAIATTDRFGNPNSALSFDGVDDFVECPNSPRLGVHQGVDMTVSVWIRPRSFDANRGFISKYLAYYPNSSEFYVSVSEEFPPGNKALCTAIGFDGVFVDAPPLNQWSHVAVVYRGTQGNATMYIKGREAGTGPLTYNPSSTTSNLVIGTIPGEGVFTFIGDIDDVRIYERALTAEEIRSLHVEQP